MFTADIFNKCVFSIHCKHTLRMHCSTQSWIESSFTKSRAFNHTTEFIFCHGLNICVHRTLAAAYYLLIKQIKNRFFVQGLEELLSEIISSHVFILTMLTSIDFGILFINFLSALDIKIFDSDSVSSGIF